MMTKNIKLKMSKGFTLIELMIALLIGTLVIGAAITIYVTTIQGSSNTLKQTRLNQDLGIAMQIMTNDIRRAGYWGGAVVGANLTLNPFSAIEVRDINDAVIVNPVPLTPVTGNCITYKYDADAYADPGYDPAVHSVVPDFNELYGFRLMNGAIQIKTPDPLEDPLDPDPECDNGVWVNLTDPDEINISQLAFTISAENEATNSTGNSVIARQVSIRIEAEMVADPSINTQLADANGVNDIVKIRNNLVTP